MLAAVSLLAMGGTTGVEADESVPGSCQLHPTHVVNPGCAPAVTDPVLTPEMTLPNLVPDVRDVRTYRPLLPDPESGQFVEGPLHLGFDSWAQNYGSVPFQLTLNSADPVSPEVSQCVVWAAPYVCRETRPVGGFTWHEPHRHFHYDDFERYELRRVGADGRPDYSDAGLLALADKVGFCLIDTERVREDGAEQPFYSTCSQVVQGLSAGWADIYDYLTPGQQFLIEGQGFSDGRYALVISLNLHGYLYETSTSDNRVEIVFELSDNLSRVTILERRYP